MSTKSKKVAVDDSPAVSTSSYVSHEEAAKRVEQAVSKVTTKKDARKLLRKLGILNKKNQLVKVLR